MRWSAITSGAGGIVVVDCGAAGSGAFGLAAKPTSGRVVTAATVALAARKVRRETDIYVSNACMRGSLAHAMQKN